MDDSLFQSLSESSVVLTANRRLASYLQNQYAQYQQSHSKTVWITPTILPLSTWLNLLWKKYGEALTILSDTQERALWKQVTQQHWTTLPSIQQAWNTLQAWDMDQEAQNIFQWADAFKQACKSHQAISAAEIPSRLLQSKDFLTNLPTDIYLIGFDDLPPIITKLLDVIKAAHKVEILKPTITSADVRRYELEDQETELKTMAAWAFSEYEKNSNQKIACIIPNLTQIRQQAVRAFEDMPVNISAGQNLNEFLIIQTAFHILHEKWENVLQSPYLAQSDDDLDMAALADKMRRAENLSHFDTTALLPFFTALLTRLPKSSYLKRWNELLAYKKNLAQQQSLNQWLDTFTEILQILQWPGTRTLTSIEHQVLQRWLKALEELSACDSYFDTLNYDAALSILQQHIHQIVFQPKSKDTPIQVLGVLETAGLSFDAIWVMGLDNENWPPAASPNPFLPYALQIQHNMPHASAERELQFTQQTMQRLLSSAKTVHLSSSKQEGDRELAPSQLISSFKTLEKSHLAEGSGHFFARYLAKKDPLTLPCDFSTENIDDCKGLSLEKNERVKGGTAVIKLQAICPFKAYANFRLNADALEKPALGLSPRLRGQLLHQALEIFWKRVQTQENLLSMSEEQLNAQIQNAINVTLESQEINKADQAFLSIEKKRLNNIINDWLLIEKERTPFTVIAEESAKTITVGTLTFQTRIDRIDQLENRSRIVIDYKTGFSSCHDWFSERPPDPQLPIYCVFTDTKHYDGLAFAQVRAGAMQFKGIINQDLEDDPLTPIADFDNIDDIDSWESLTTHWKTNIEKLSEIFSSGEAQVDPLETACDFCELKPLCRVNECQP